MEIATKMETKPVTYFAFHKSQFVAGLLLLLVGFMGLIFLYRGLIFFCFAFPPFIWMGLVPMIFGIIFTIRSFLSAEKIEVIHSNGKWSFNSSQGFGKAFSINQEEILYMRTIFRESKVMRWFAALVLFEIAFEVHYENGIDLWGHAIIAPILIISFILTSLATTIFLLAPREYIEIGTTSHSYYIPLPNMKNAVNLRQQVLDSLGFGKTKGASNIERKTRGFSWIVKHEPLSLLMGTTFIALAVALSVCDSFFLGDFTTTIITVLGLKHVARLITRSKYINCTSFVANGGIEESNIRVNFTRIHFLELASYGYVLYHLIRQGFRPIWWPYAGFSMVYLLACLGFVALILLHVTLPVKVIKVKFGNFSVVFKGSFPGGFKEAFHHHKYAFRNIHIKPTRTKRKI
ncbi:MAG: hypothetical protein ACTSUE_22610 [Promethearchaeota archaeon]